MSDNNDLSVLHLSASWPSAAPLLSVLIPTYDHDVVPLCRELLADMCHVPSGTVELLVLIDGNPGLVGHDAVVAEADRLAQPTALALAATNLGRSGARNRLARLARGQFLHFLDADSLPDAPGFVGRTLDMLRKHATSGNVVLCGGRTGQRVPPPPPDARLFTVHSRKREWISAAERNRDPAGCFLSANFVVAKTLFLEQPFDDRFKGWGWEDTEWALRISQHARIIHVENTVSHMEHHRDIAWLGRVERGASNYALLYRLHPEAVRRHRIFQLIKILAPLRNMSPLASLLRWMSLRSNVSPSLRLITFKFLQALKYAKTINSQIF